MFLLKFLVSKQTVILVLSSGLKISQSAYKNLANCVITTARLKKGVGGGHLDTFGYETVRNSDIGQVFIVDYTSPTCAA